MLDEHHIVDLQVDLLCARRTVLIQCLGEWGISDSKIQLEDTKVLMEQSGDLGLAVQSYYIYVCAPERKYCKNIHACLRP